MYHCFTDKPSKLGTVSFKICQIEARKLMEKWHNSGP